METMITIPYEDFKEMLEKVSLCDSILMDLEYLIRDSELDYYKKDLELSGSMRTFARKFCPDNYEDKLRIVKREYEKSKEDKKEDK